MVILLIIKINFNKINSLLNKFPILITPKNCGLRQPIHIKELAKFIEHLINSFIAGDKCEQKLLLAEI